MPLRGDYQGSSFFELLQLEKRHLLPDLSAWGEERQSSMVPHGTTVLAMRFRDGVLVAGDRLATAGHSVASRDVVKVFATDPAFRDGDLRCRRTLYRDGAGAVGRTRALREDRGRVARTRGQGQQTLPDDPREPAGRHAGTRGRTALRGLRHASQERSLWKFDITGGRYEEMEFDATGSGGLYARESLKHGWNADLIP